MNCILWNCRGLRRPQAVRALKDMVCISHRSLLFLCETKSCKSYVVVLRVKLGFAHYLISDRVGLEVADELLPSGWASILQDKSKSK